MHGGAWLGLTITSAFVHSGVTEEHATGVFCHGQITKLFNEHMHNAKHTRDDIELPVPV